MREIRNADGKLVCLYDEKKHFIEIVRKGCTTLVKLKTDGTLEIINSKTEAA